MDIVIQFLQLKRCALLENRGTLEHPERFLSGRAPGFTRGGSESGTLLSTRVCEIRDQYGILIVK